LFLFASASIASVIGILQHFGFIQTEDPNRPAGFSGNPNFYAGILAIVCSSAITMIFLHDRDLFTTKSELNFLRLVASLTLCAIILSQSRGIWVALFTAPIITLYLNNRRSAYKLLLLFIAVSALMLFSSKILQQRAVSIVTSIYTEDEKGSTGLRIEYWKAALIIFKEHPWLGSGLGDFEPDIEKLVADKRIKQIPTLYSHAHNIYLQVLATRGLIGLAILLVLATALLRWGINIARIQGGTGGYTIIVITLLTMIAGMSDNHIEFTVFLASSTLSIGILGPYGISRQAMTPLPNANVLQSGSLFKRRVVQ
jgi:O-antigen ligase